MKFAAFATLLGVAACGTGERPFRMVQLCLANTGEIATMKAVVREVAESNKLPFEGNSEGTEADLNSVAAVQKDVPIARPTVNVGTVGPTAMGFSAGNFAEASSQTLSAFRRETIPSQRENCLTLSCRHFRGDGTYTRCLT